MRLIARSVLLAYARRHPETAVPLERWYRLVKAANWSSMDDIRRVSPKANVLNRDRARFEVAGGNYRLIASFDFRSANSVHQVYRHACRIRRHRSADCCQILMRTTMQIRPVRTSKNHRAALAEIEKLWGASIGTPEGDKLDVLVTLVETYGERRGSMASCSSSGSM